MASGEEVQHLAHQQRRLLVAHGGKIYQDLRLLVICSMYRLKKKAQLLCSQKIKNSEKHF